MVDIHSHILFGVDDGASNLEESLNMLRQAKKLGYTDIVCTSHYYVGRFENQNYHKNFEILKDALKKEKIDINIYKGNEFALKEDSFFSIDKSLKINNGKYILIEIKGMIIYSICKEFFKKLLDRGIVPIFAHIERYPHIKQKEFEELYKMGVILQINLQSVLNMPSKIENLLNKKYIGVVATDSHKFGKRDYDMNFPLEELRKIVDKNYFEELTNINPKKIIDNKVINITKEGENNEIKKNNWLSSIFGSLWGKLFS